MRNCGAEFVRGVWRYHVAVDARDAARVCVLDWDGEVPVLAGRWDDAVGRIVDWSPELLAPEGSATEALANLASAALRREHEWVAAPSSAAHPIAAVPRAPVATPVPVEIAVQEAAIPAAIAPVHARVEPVQLALSVVMFGATTPANADETGPRTRASARLDGSGSTRRRPRRPGRSTRVG